MENSNTIVLKESDMLVKEIGRVKMDNNARVFVAIPGPKSPKEMQKSIFIVHENPDEEFSMDLVKFEGEYMRGATSGCTAFAQSYSKDAAIESAKGYLTMLNNQKKRDWDKSFGPYYGNDDAFHGLLNKHVKNEVKDSVALTPRKDLSVVILGGYNEDSYEGPHRVHPKQSVKGLCEVYEKYNTVDKTLEHRRLFVDTKAFGKVKVNTGFFIDDKEYALLKKAMDNKVPVRVAVSDDGKSVLVDAERLGKNITEHKDVSINISYNFCDRVIDIPYEDDQLEGKLVHAFNIREFKPDRWNEKWYSARVEVEETDGDRVMWSLEASDQRGLRALKSLKGMEGHDIRVDLVNERKLMQGIDRYDTRSFHVYSIKDLSLTREKKGKGLSL